MSVSRRFIPFFVRLAVLLLAITACSSPPPETPSATARVSDEATEPATLSMATAEPITAVETEATAVPTSETPPPMQTRSASQMRSYALEAANLLSLVDLSQSRPLSPGETQTGRITADTLAVPFTYAAQAGDVLLVELLLPDLPEADMQTVRPALFIADAAGNEIGYMRGGLDFVNLDEKRSIAQAGFVVQAAGNYTILATLDGHYAPAQNPGYEADFAFTVTPAQHLSVNQVHEATRDAAERQVYAVRTAVGQFDIVYEEVSGEPPGRYDINIYRVGGPADGLALADVMAAGYPYNFTVPFNDNAYASIAETMGLEQLTYIITINSSVLPGEAQPAYTSNYRLTISQASTVGAPVGEVAATVNATSTPAAADEVTWESRLNHTMRVQFQLPTGWEVASGNNSVYGRDGASLVLSFADQPYDGVPPFTDAATACQGLTQGIAAAAFGTGTGEVVTVNGRDVCVISRPQSGDPYRAIIKFPEPVQLTGSIGHRGTWNFLNIEIEPADYFWPIVESIRFPEETSALLYTAGALDILKAHYYFRDQMDWEMLEAGLNARLDENSTLDEAYNALYWLMEEMAAAVNHHHMTLRTPEQVQEALKGEQYQPGLNMLGNVITLVFPNSPAALAGLQVGDQIITVNGDNFAEANFNTNAFDLVVERDGEQFEVTLARQTISYIVPPRSQRLGDIAYLETFGIFGAELPLLQAYAADVQAAIQNLDSTNTCGWILDVRRNTGGSLHAILAGIAPLVGGGELYRVQSPDGHEETTFYEDGRVFGRGTAEFPAMVDTSYDLNSPNPPLAVLVSSGTNSAGEVSAIVVRGRPDSQAHVFGEQTPGQTTPVFSANLYDGGLLLAPDSLVVDLEGRTYLEGIIPDEEVPVVYDERYGTPDDPVVQAALTWLAAEYGCSP